LASFHPEGLLCILLHKTVPTAQQQITAWNVESTATCRMPTKSHAKHVCLKLNCTNQNLTSTVINSWMEASRISMAPQRELQGYV
jgi:hypothetical protein